MKFTILTTVQFTVSGMEYTYNVMQPSPLYIFWAFSPFQTENVYSSENSTDVKTFRLATFDPPKKVY